MWVCHVARIKEGGDWAFLMLTDRGLVDRCGFSNGLYHRTGWVEIGLTEAGLVVVVEVAESVAPICSAVPHS